MIREIPELVRMWEDGGFARGDLMTRFFGLIESHPVEEVVAGLPEPWRGEFVDWIREMYDNDAPASSFVWLRSSAPEPPYKGQLIAAVRDWLKAHPPQHT